jgi:hypothetical protein
LFLFNVLKRVSGFVETGSQSYQTFFSKKQIFFLFFGIKLGRFKVQAIFSICYKKKKLSSEKKEKNEVW